MAPKSTPKAAELVRVEIPKTDVGQLALGLVGTSPYICNRMSEKAKHELLLPRRKTAADRANSQKHDPLAEFRASPYRLPEDQPTLLAMMASSVKKAMMTAALDVPGASRTQIGRLVWVEDLYLPIWGIPKLFSAVTRSADINKTPDIRTRAIVPNWATFVRVSYIKPFLTQQAAVNLLTMAGQTAGVGDWRPEKGAGNFGQFRVADGSDPEFKELVDTAGRIQQEHAMEEPECYDLETRELVDWATDEIRRRGAVA